MFTKNFHAPCSFLYFFFVFRKKYNSCIIYRAVLNRTMTHMINYDPLLSPLAQPKPNPTIYKTKKQDVLKLCTLVSSNKLNEKIDTHTWEREFRKWGVTIYILQPLQRHFQANDSYLLLYRIKIQYRYLTKSAGPAVDSLLPLMHHMLLKVIVCCFHFLTQTTTLFYGVNTCWIAMYGFLLSSNLI